MSARSVLEARGRQPHLARTLATRFKRHNIAPIDAMVPHCKDEDKLIAAATQGRQQLEELFAHGRGDAVQRQVGAGGVGLVLVPRECDAIREFLGGPLHGTWHIPEAVKCGLSQVRIDMTRKTRSAIDSIPRGVGRLQTTRLTK